MPLIAMSSMPVAPQYPSADAVYGPYLLCGWKITSVLPLPELEHWPHPDPEPSEVTEIQFALADKSFRQEGEFGYKLDADGAFVLQLPGLAAFRIAPDASSVLIAPHADADPVLLRAHLYGSVVAVLCYLLGLLPLHGACVQVGDSAVIFTGKSGAGKSTLAAAFAQRGFPVLCDDVCAIDLAATQVRVWPAFPRLKLLPDAIEAFGLDGRTLYTRAVHGEKGHFRVAETGPGAGEAVPLAAVYLLGELTADAISIERLRGASAFLALRTQLHRSNMGEALGLRGRNFSDLTALTGAVPTYQLNRPNSLLRMDEVVQRIVAMHTPPSAADLT